MLSDVVAVLVSVLVLSLVASVFTLEAFTDVSVFALFVVSFLTSLLAVVSVFDASADLVGSVVA